MNENPENNTKKILDLYQRYDFPEELTDEIIQWLVSDFHAEEKEKAVHGIWDELPHLYDIKEEYMLEKIKTELGIPDKRPLFLKRSFIRTMVAAAIIILLVTTGLFKYLELKTVDVEQPLLATTISTGEKEKKHAELISYIQTWVNSRTVMTYIDPTEVELNGEAFFDIRKSENTHFSVKGNALKAIVTGTRFNFRSYDVEDISVISLYEGQLNIIAPDTIIKLDAGYELEYNRVTGLLTIRNIDRQQPDWMREIINFDSAQVVDIFRSLEKIYGIKIDITDFRVTEDEIELKFEEGLSLNEVMFFMSSITGTFDYIISDDIVYVRDKKEIK